EEHPSDGGDAAGAHTLQQRTPARVPVAAWNTFSATIAPIRLGSVKLTTYFLGDTVRQGVERRSQLMHASLGVAPTLVLYGCRDGAHLFHGFMGLLQHGSGPRPAFRRHVVNLRTRPHGLA